MQKAKSLVLIGAGRVAFHLGRRLSAGGWSISQVFSRSLHKAIELAGLIGAQPTDDLEEITDTASVYLIAISDKAIAEVAAQMTHIGNQLVVHTSGATPSSVLSPFFQRYGVFYPLQTFSFEREPDFSAIPVCIDASEQDDLVILRQMAESLGGPQYLLDDQDRALAHLAAVMVNNFSNHLYSIGADILARRELPFDLLRPLILETAEKIRQHHPDLMQTGPAARGDQSTINRHLSMLATFQPEWSELYKVLTTSIIKNPKGRTGAKD